MVGSRYTDCEGTQEACAWEAGMHRLDTADLEGEGWRGRSACMDTDTGSTVEDMEVHFLSFDSNMGDFV